MVDAALCYAERGWRVFPVHGIVRSRCTCGRRGCSSPGKHPLTRRGVHEATTDEDVIRDWWRRWRSANVGIATGRHSGIVVVDIDLPLALASLDHVLGLLPVTLTGLTGGGGVHLVYSCDRMLSNSAGRLPGVERDLPGIDLRADGGYVLAPPSIHSRGWSYGWLDPLRPLAPAPSWLEHQLEAAPVRATQPPSFDGDGSAYGLAVLRDELQRLRSARVGTRNHQLNRSGFALARLVAGGELSESAAREELLVTAIAIGLDDPEARQTIDSAFAAGSRSPRCAPHRLRS